MIRPLSRPNGFGRLRRQHNIRLSRLTTRSCNGAAANGLSPVIGRCGVIIAMLSRRARARHQQDGHNYNNNNNDNNNIVLRGTNERFRVPLGRTDANRNIFRFDAANHSHSHRPRLVCTDANVCVRRTLTGRWRTYQSTRQRVRFFFFFFFHFLSSNP